ncbi:hypothetical protein PGB28_16360 [Primorskyibacter aestuariivivens]|uniref:hypothetical protein n=1 Tax=Primorskyibacter aestuariivivens TaxID=1888912 RepID=UPI0023001087|nr:hypothetical protein [Primorskyibacter aestuariivivens]MDA7430040.1 hypothetical protein [Primorskyibacter aestuariivivens]
MTPDQTLKNAIMNPDGTVPNIEIKGAQDADAEASRLRIWTIRMLLVASALLVARGLMPGSEVQTFASNAGGALIDMVEQQRDAWAQAAAEDARAILAAE